VNHGHFGGEESDPLFRGQEAEPGPGLVLGSLQFPQDALGVGPVRGLAEHFAAVFRNGVGAEDPTRRGRGAAGDPGGFSMGGVLDERGDVVERAGIGFGFGARHDFELVAGLSQELATAGG